jgi:adenylyltransferase/sulfurtransferase
MTIRRAVIVGAGGLGGPIARCLGQAGIEVEIVDPDVVEASNLHRQIHFGPSDIAKHKADALAATIVAGGGSARGHVRHWTIDVADALAGDAELIVDGSDDPATKFAVADWAVANGRSYVIASALAYGGNAMVGAPGAACYRCLFEDPALDVPTCADAGVLGPVVGVIGGVAAALAIGLARGDRSHAGSIFVFDDLRTAIDPRVVRFGPRRGCPTCARAPISPFDLPARVAGQKGS